MKERLVALTVLMMAIGALYVFDGINTQLSGNSVTGLAVSDQSAEQGIVQQDISCFDTDNRDHYTQGTTYAQLFKANGELPKEDTCEVSSLIEYYCIFNEPQVEFYDCPNGCSNGACVS